MYDTILRKSYQVSDGDQSHAELLGAPASITVLTNKQTKTPQEQVITKYKAFLIKEHNRRAQSARC
jgi:hypothetical protein